MKIPLSAMFLVFLLASPAIGHAGQNNDDQDRARRRSYPGGSDEEDIKVQDGLPLAVKKFTAKHLQNQVFKSLYDKDAEESTSR